MCLTQCLACMCIININYYCFITLNNIIKLCQYMTMICLNLFVCLFLINDNGFGFLCLESSAHYNLELVIHLVEMSQALT